MKKIAPISSQLNPRLPPCFNLICFLFSLAELYLWLLYLQFWRLTSACRPGSRQKASASTPSYTSWVSPSVYHYDFSCSRASWTALIALWALLGVLGPNYAWLYRIQCFSSFTDDSLWNCWSLSAEVGVCFRAGTTAATSYTCPLHLSCPLARPRIPYWPALLSGPASSQGACCPKSVGGSSFWTCPSNCLDSHTYSP